ncbi:MAG: hypothetical protein NZ960_08225 [Candidatus Kapabacteria bacterium]|nr:hypothetical protein [Candidatus Kapabacteria bacterium]MDW8012440.1 hypothetical protein [Bacteroidota bacterium]
MLQHLLLSKSVLGFIFPLWCFASIANSLRQLNTRGDDYIVGLLGPALIISRDGASRYRAIWLRDDARWNLPQLKALLADTTFLPRTILSDSPQPTVLGTVNTPHRSAELAVRRWNGTEWSLPEPLKELNSSA